MDLFKKSVFNITKTFNRLARFLFLLIMLLVVGNVIMRFFGKPFDGSYEWVGFLMGTAISLSLAYCALQGGHISITLLSERFSRSIQQALELMEKLLSLIFLVMVVRMLILYGTRMLSGGHVGMNTGVPLYYFAYIIACGFLVYCLAVAYNLVKSAEKMIKR